MPLDRHQKTLKWAVGSLPHNRNAESLSNTDERISRSRSPSDSTRTPSCTSRPWPRTPASPIRPLSTSTCGIGLQEPKTRFTHGDYYRRNLLCNDSHVTGVIDWHDAAVRPLALELAGATFEFCRNDEHELDLGRVRDFVAAYRAHGSPVPDREIRMLLRFLRWWIRADSRTSFTCSRSLDNAYTWKQVRAFVDLRQAHLDLDIG